LITKKETAQTQYVLELCKAEETPEKIAQALYDVSILPGLARQYGRGPRKCPRVKSKKTGQKKVGRA
jgi:hypothetical protein